jgi:uncharacterized membrane protein YhdT
MEKNTEKEPDFTKEELEEAKKALTTKEGFLADPRYKQCNKEAIYGIVLGVFNFILWAVFGYGFGSGPAEDYKYILGLPLWFALSCILTPIVIIILTFVLVNKMDDMPLDKFTEEEAIKYEAMKRRKNNG